MSHRLASAAVVRRWLPAVIIAGVVPALFGCSAQVSAGADAERNAYRAQMRTQLGAYGEVNAATKNGTCQNDVLSADCRVAIGAVSE